MQKFFKKQLNKKIKFIFTKKTVYKIYCFEFNKKFIVKDNGNIEFDTLTEAIKYTNKSLVNKLSGEKTPDN